ncbi:hypothetical protein DPMN_026983 [Dreissena polymorpha]|uniref:Uncharacterized protein n=1 Tax=Dreissena polymorpha TaxID=45954 RepID=A0A9D4LS93_DREPO|nr:hypothetical protein DPMN_026983 [Dreissena polymorpha]
MTILDYGIGTITITIKRGLVLLEDEQREELHKPWVMTEIMDLCDKRRKLMPVV